MENNNEVLLKVDHLCQYFRLGRKDLKAVDDVCFEVKKGETFGLVGESGCGKTTTGRSIINLYDITSGNIYFKGERIAAGTRSYKNAIKAARAEANAKIKSLQEEAKSADENRKAAIKSKVEAIKQELAEVVVKNKGLISEARFDYKNAKKNKLSTQIQMIFQDPIASLDPRMTDRKSVV